MSPTTADTAAPQLAHDGEITAPRYWWVDRIRVMTIFIVVVFHVVCTYAEDLFGPGIQFHVWNDTFLSEAWYFVLFVDPWQMHILFLLAGFSLVFSLKKRGLQQFVKERLLRLGAPILFGYAILMAAQTYISVLYAYKVVPDIAPYYYYFIEAPSFGTFYRYLWPHMLTGGHLWFIIVLLPMSLVAGFIVSKRLENAAASSQGVKLGAETSGGSSESQPVRAIQYFFQPWFLIFYALISAPLDILGQVIRISVFQWSQALFFVFGIMLALHMEYLPVIQKHAKWALPLGFAGLVCYAIWPNILSLLKNIGAWYFVYGLIGVFSRSQRKPNRALRSLSKASMAIYIIHLPIEVAVGYFISPMPMNPYLKAVILVVIIFTLSYAFYFLIKLSRIKILYFIFGISAGSSKKAVKQASKNVEGVPAPRTMTKFEINE
jgi:glucans biosynthesis protein C